VQGAADESHQHVLTPPGEVQTCPTVCSNTCLMLQRVLLLSYDKTSKRIHLRHFSISAQPSGVSKSVKALVSQRAVPDMGNVQDVSEFLSKSGYGSVSNLGMSCCCLSSSVGAGEGGGERQGGGGGETGGLGGGQEGGEAESDVGEWGGAWV